MHIIYLFITIVSKQFTRTIHNCFEVREHYNVHCLFDVTFKDITQLNAKLCSLHNLHC